jgi:hypothetical protein
MMFKSNILACFYEVILSLRMLTKTFLIIPFLIEGTGRLSPVFTSH